MFSQYKLIKPGMLAYGLPSLPTQPPCLEETRLHYYSTWRGVQYDTFLYTCLNSCGIGQACNVAYESHDYNAKHHSIESRVSESTSVSQSEQILVALVIHTVQ